jgi:phosphoribosylformimino-5-aminoimidazole carboxamide ribotide isomerase
MRILPVLDLKGGVVVRGIAGRRAEYRPIVSQLTDSTHPADIASAFQNYLGLTELYIADLDAIAGAAPAFADYAAIRARGGFLLVDAGVCELSQAQRLADAGIERIVVGLETLAGPAELRRIVQQLGSTRVVFSLDLRDGRPLGDVAAWAKPDAEAIARQAIDAGVAAMIVLDLSRVGVGEGVGTEDLCRRLHERFPGVECIAGGGVRGVADLHRLRECGVQAALVASALHDGRITREDLVGRPS